VTKPVEEFLSEYGVEGLDETVPSEIARPTVTKIFVNGQGTTGEAAGWLHMPYG
jgi:hypothetical protein